MIRRSLIPLLLWCLPAAGGVIDRIAVIVDKHVIKSSDIDRDVRVAEFLNREPLNMNADVKKRAAERLIDQTVIREEMEKGGYAVSSEAEVNGMMKRLLTERFGGSEAKLQQELGRYGLREAQLTLQLQWQADALKFIDQRFRPGVSVTDQEVQDYYNQHKADLQRQFPQLKTFAPLEPKIRAALEGERLNRNFDEWLRAARKRDRIVYRQEALE